MLFQSERFLLIFLFNDQFLFFFFFLLFLFNVIILLELLSFALITSIFDYLIVPFLPEKIGFTVILPQLIAMFVIH